MIGTYRSQKPEMVRPRHFSHNLVNPFLSFFGQISTPEIRNEKKCCRFFTFFTIFRHFSSLIKIAQRGIFSCDFEKCLKNRQKPSNPRFYPVPRFSPTFILFSFLLCLQIVLVFPSIAFYITVL